MLNLFDRNGNDAKIVKISQTKTRNGAYLYHVTLDFDEAHRNITATAYVDPNKSTKMQRLMHVYDRFQAGDKVHANLYQHNRNFIDIYRLQLIKDEQPAQQANTSSQANVTPDTKAAATKQSQPADNSQFNQALFDEMMA